MRNLKRALSLVMAAAMLIGMMVVSASAADNYEDFTDKDEIQNTEAVATMVSLGVFNGKEDGSYFDPTGIVTRAEMAKIIAVSLNGGKDPVLGSGAATTQFTDTKGNWAEAYIAYCANLGIINGKGDGTFGPNEPVTGTAAAKMFLTALGYRSDIEGLTGAGWDLKTDTLANKVGLYDGLDAISPSSGLTRDNTAQLVYNGVQAQEVQYRNNYGEYSGVIYAQETGTMLANRFGVIKVTGIVMANDEFALGSNAVQKDGRTMLDVVEAVDYGSGSYSDETTFNVDTDASLIGQEVVIYVKPASKLNPNPSADAVMGTPIVTDNNTVVTTYAKLNNTTDPTWSKFLKDNDLTDGGDGYVNYAARTVSDNDRGVILTFIDNTGDGKVDIKLAVEKTLAKVSTYNKSKEYVKFSGDATEYGFEDVIGLDDIALNDYVLYYVANGNAHVEVLEKVTASLDSYKEGKNATLDGTTYKNSELTNNAGDLTTFTAAFAGNDSALDFGNSYDLYLDNDNNLIAYKIAEESELKDYAVILDAGIDVNTLKSDPTGQVKLLLSDGTKVTGSIDMKASQANYKKFDETNAADLDTFAEKYVDVNNVLGAGAASEFFIGSLVTYTESSNGYVLRPTNDKAATTTSTNVVKNMASLTLTGSGSGKAVVNANTIFFFLNGKETTVITGTNNLSSTAIGAANVKDVAYTGTGTQVAKAIYLTADPGTTNSNYAYVLKGAVVKPVDGVNYEFYTAVLADGTVETFQTETGTDITVSGIYKYETNSKGVTDLTATTVDTDGILADISGTNESVAGYISTLSGNVIGVTYNGVENFYSVGNAKIYNAEDTDDVFTTDLAKNQSIFASVTKSNGNFVLDAIYITENDVSEYGVYLNGVKINDYKVGESVTVSVPAVAAAADITVSGAARTDTSSTTTAAFVMPAGDVNVTSVYELTPALTGCKLYASYDAGTKTPSGEVTSATKYAPGITLYVVMDANNTPAVTGLSSLTQLVAGDDSNPYVYTYTTTAVAVTLTVSNA